MGSSPPIVGGHTGFSTSALQLLAATQRQVEEVAAYRSTPRDFSAPRMELASSLPAAPLADMQPRFDASA